VLDREVTMADYYIVLERRQQSCVVRSWKTDRQAFVNSTSGTAEVAATGTHCNWNAQFLEVPRCGLMQTLEVDRAELENYSLWNWQPVKISSKCWCYALKLPRPHYKSRS